MTSARRSRLQRSHVLRSAFGALLAGAVLSVLPATEALAQLSVGVSVQPEQPRVGEQLSVQITVSNRDAVTPSGITMTVDIPAGIETFQRNLITGLWTSVSCSQLGSNATCEDGEFGHWIINPLAAGESHTVSFSAIVASVPDGTLIPFVATVTPDVGVGLAASATATVDSLRTIDLSVDVLPDPVEPGDDVDYVLHFGNTSTTDPSPNAELEFALPAGTSFVSASDGGVQSGGVVSWSLGDVAPGVSGQRELTLTVGAGFDDGSLLVAQAEFSDAAPSPQQVFASALHEVDSGEPLELAFAVNPDPARMGEQLDVTATITNTAAINAAGVQLAIRMPQGIEDFQRDLVTGLWNSTSCSQLGPNATCESGEYAFWNVGSLAAGESHTVSLPPVVANVAEGTLIPFRGRVRSGTTNDNEAKASRSVAVDSSRILDLAIDALRSPVDPGDDIVFTLRFGNSPAVDTVPNAQLEFALPAGASFVSASDGGVLVGDDVVWSLGDLSPGENSERQLTVTASAALEDGSLLVSQAELTESVASTRRAIATSIVEVDLDEPLEVVLSVSADPAPIGGKLDVAATITNVSAVVVAGVEFEARLPEGIEPFQRDLLGGAWTTESCSQLGSNSTCESGEYAYWFLGALDPGESANATLPPVIASSVQAGQQITFRGWVRGQSTDDHGAMATRAVPEPNVVTCLAAGIVGLAWIRRRKADHARS